MPEGPRTPPSAQTLHWISRPYDYLRHCHDLFGEAFTLDFGARGIYCIFSNPEALRAIFTAGADVLHVGPGNAVLEPLVGRASLLLLEEGRHQRERRLLLPAFQPKTVTRYANVIRAAVAGATRDWHAGTEFDAQSVLQTISIDVILRAVLGLPAAEHWGELKANLVGLLNDRRLTMGLLGRLHEDAPDPVIEDFRQRLQGLRGAALDLIASRRARASDPDEDILSLLLAATDEQGRPRADDEICDELLTLVVTGHETTATALAWGLYWMTTHAEVARRLAAEVRGAGAEAGATTELEYLDAICKEILRICPIVPSVFRQVARPFSVAGYRFHPGVVLSPSIYLTHHREDIYPDGDRFDPERFLRRTYSPYEYLPFGGGLRRCIGMHLALYEMKLVLVELFRRYELRLASAGPVVPTRRIVAMAPSGGPHVVVQRVLP